MQRNTLAHLAHRMLPPNLLRFVRTTVYARSLHTACVLHTKKQYRTSIRLPGYSGDFRLRTGTSDAMFLGMLANGYDLPEYRIPKDCHTRTILDLGANIGFASLQFARSFPNAEILAFEPLPANFELLRHNVAQVGQITPIPYGLGPRTETKRYYHSVQKTNNTGGFYNDGSLSWNEHGAHSGFEPLPVLAVPEAFERFGITRADVIKIDTEGAEYDILASIPPKILDSVSVIVGEFHGTHNDRLHRFLQERFDVTWTETHKRSPDPNGGIGVFQAVRKTAPLPHVASNNVIPIPRNEAIRNLAPALAIGS